MAYARSILNFVDIDSLYHRQYPMLWCRDRCRHRIHNCSHLLEHGITRTLYWSQTQGRDCNDHAQANALSVCRTNISDQFNILIQYPSYQGHIGAALVLGGVDASGPHLFTIHPHGSTDKLPYVTMGSGSLAAMAVFEARWQPNMEVRIYHLLYFAVASLNHSVDKPTSLMLTSFQRAEALDLVCAAVSAGIFNDLGSGSNVDACVITASHTEMLRNFVRPNERVQKERSYTFRRGTTEWKKEEIRALVVEEDITFTAAGRGAEEAMDTS